MRKENEGMSKDTVQDILIVTRGDNIAVDVDHGPGVNTGTRRVTDPYAHMWIDEGGEG